MATPVDPQKNENRGTYVVQQQHKEAELNRLRIQDQMITASMGGVLPEFDDPSHFRRVLDVGCGSGGWAIEAAETYPDMSLFGIDINPHMIEYARAQAQARQVNGRVEFAVMDALLYLEFPDRFFDLVNLRFGVSFMRTWDWPKMISELLRVSRNDGIIRVTDEYIVHPSNSPALTRLLEMVQCALFQAGHLFENETTGLTAHLVSLLTQHGCMHVQSRPYALEFRAGTPHGQAYYEDVRHVVHNIRPFLQKWGCLAPEYDEVSQQALHDIQQSDFHVTWPLLTAWGTRS